MKHTFRAFIASLILINSLSLTGCIGLRACSPGGLLSCSGGCGETYVGEYINHPPVCDPCGSSCDGGCDSIGCDSACGGSCGGFGYSGPRPATCRPLLARLSQFWGIRYIPSSCGNCGIDGCNDCGGGCSSCGEGSSSYLGEKFLGGPSVIEGHSVTPCNCGQSHGLGNVMSPTPIEQFPTPTPIVPSEQFDNQPTLSPQGSQSRPAPQGSQSRPAPQGSQSRPTSRRPARSTPKLSSSRNTQSHTRLVSHR